MEWNKAAKEKIHYGTAIVGFVSGILMCFISFLQTGTIDGSVLGYMGICVSFTAAVFGISLHYTNELNNFKQDITKLIDEKMNGISA